MPIGLAISSQSDAQQSPAWSPQPYVKPATDSIPKNSLRADFGSETSTEVVRWRKVEGAPQALPASYSQSLPLETAQQPIAKPSDAPVIRQPSSTLARRDEMPNGSAQLQPASGWVPKNTAAKAPTAEPAKIKLDNKVQFASFEAPASAERDTSHMASSPSRLRLNPSEASSRR
ncbi:MAG: hypothetical protein MUC83_18545, partial [Pirellula sp.]|nr:hypothetical protein [Pirellula sp.]